MLLKVVLELLGVGVLGLDLLGDLMLHDVTGEAVEYEADDEEYGAPE